jgi:hypothetical protein
MAASMVGINQSFAGCGPAFRLVPDDYRADPVCSVSTTLVRSAQPVGKGAHAGELAPFRAHTLSLGIAPARHMAIDHVEQHGSAGIRSPWSLP